MRPLFRMLGTMVTTAVLVGACSGGGASSPTPSPSTAASSAPSPSQSANPSSSMESVKLTYFTFSAAPEHLEDLNAIVTAFETEHPNITIEVQTAAFDEYFTKLQTAIAGGTAADTFELNYENFVTYASAGSLLDISALSQPTASTYYPRAFQVFQADGKQYGLPESFSDVLLFYNKDLFDRAGVAYPTADWKWSDELAAAKKLTDSSKDVWGDYQPVQFWEFYKVLAQNGGAFFNVDMTKSTFNDAKGVEAANWLIDKTNKDKVMPTAAQLGSRDDGALFKAGNLAIWHTGIWMFTGLKDVPFNWDVEVEPGNAQKASHFFANAVVASANTPHPEEAFEWLSFLTSSSVAIQTRLAASWELPAVADQTQFASYLSQTPPANRQAVFDALADIVVPPVIAQESQMSDIVTQALQQAQLGQISVEDALNGAAQQVDALLK